MNNPIPALPATLARLEGSSAILKLADGQELRIPATALPKDIAVGAPVSLAVLAGADAQEARDALGRSVLNELLKE